MSARETESPAGAASKPEPEPPVPPARAKPRRRRRARLTILSLWFPLLLIAALATVTVFAVTLTQRRVAMPAWVTERVEGQLNARLAGQGSVRVGGLELSMIDGIAPTIHLRNVSVSDRSGAELAQLAELNADFDLDALLSGTIDTRSLNLRGAEITFFRRTDGSFAVAFGDSQRASGDLAAILDQLDRAFLSGPLAAIDRFELTDLTVIVEDARANRIWQATSGRLDVVQTAEKISAGLTFDVFSGTDDLAPVSIAIESQKGSPAATLKANFTSALSGDIALQSPGLSFLSLLDAPIDGAIELDLGDDASVTRFAGAIEIGAGTFAPSTGGGAIGVKSGAASFSFDPGAGRIAFDRLTLSTDTVAVDLAGQVLLDRPDAASWPESLVAQLEIRAGTFSDERFFTAPIELADGNADFRVRLQPFAVDIGQLRLSDGISTVLARGAVAAPTSPNGAWDYRVSASLDEIPYDRVARYWPLPVAAKAREWYTANVSAGTFSGIQAAIQSGEDGPERLITWNMAETTVRFMEQMPLITGGAGYGSIENTRFAVTAETGTITPEGGGPVAIDGTTMLIEDTRIRPTPAIFDLMVAGDIGGAMRLLNQPPLLVMDKAGQSVDLASGRVAARAAVRTILAKGIPPSDIDWQARARLTDVTAPSLAPTGVLTADALTLTATPTDLLIEGPMKLDGVTFDARFTQKIGEASDGVSRISGDVTLGPDFIDEFSIGLPAGSVRGEGPGSFTLEIAKGEPIRFSLKSTLAGLGLRLDALSWSKAAKTAGSLALTGRIDGTPVIDSLSFNAAGLSAEGAITVSANGGLDRATFSRVKAGGWLDAPVTLTGRGRNATPAIEVGGGSLDFRRANFGSGASTEGGPLAVRLGRLIIADGIELTGFNGKFTSTRAGLDGGFTAKLNNGGTLAGRVVPTSQGTALVVTSDNGGQLLQDAGVAQKIRGGALELRLQPTGEAGIYRGALQIDKFSVHQMPILAELLSAISGIGLLQKLSGDGIPFDIVEADFTLTPSYIQISRASAVGPSMGVAAQGAYTLGTGALNIRGTVAPLYFVNAVGQIFSGKGGGLFTFNFTVKGTTEVPKVQVNPLSILAPGMFKEIFRRPPPKPIE